ncbi:MAG: hypothetical protein RMN51_02245 [Verrucomicrobiota bacterium]|nr:hypothetical protein [Limisphaera sp.]MDW8380916.1 hypothetical protein [Verrucomicrobiota bacterium]
MSTLPEHEFDLEKLFLPAWATEPPKPPVSARGREDAPGGERKGFRRNRDRVRTKAVRTTPGHPATGSAPGPAFSKPTGAVPGGKAGRQPLPDLEVRLIPDPKGAEHVARRIRSTGRAFPLFDIAKLFLERPERYSIEIRVKKKSDGTVRQPLFLCALDDTAWLSADEVVAHVLEKHFDTFYQAERTPTEPPKGKYTFVAQCGYSGVILGPPNHHDYPNRLRQLHAERFAHIPFETYKARVKIVRDETVVKQWLEEQSWKTEYICLNVPEPLRLGSREAVERHFREVHAPTLVREVELVTLPGTKVQDIPCRPLARLVRHAVEEQRRFPLQIATALSQQFAAHGLQFFKVNRTITHVSVARPHYLDIETTPVSLNVRQIVQFILQHPGCNRRDLIEALAPSPKGEAPSGAPAPSATEPTSAASPSAPQVAPANETAAGQADQLHYPAPTPEQTQLIADLHWLIHQGHVIEFSNGRLEVAKKPAPKPAPVAKAQGKERTGAIGAPAESSSQTGVTMAQPAPNATETGTERVAGEIEAGGANEVRESTQSATAGSTLAAICGSSVTACDSPIKPEVATSSSDSESSLLQSTGDSAASGLKPTPHNDADLAAGDTPAIAPAETTRPPGTTP